jgi:uncharacterized membrane protein
VRRDTALALLVLAASFALTLGIGPWSDQSVNDLFVYRVFTEPVLHGAVPYRDAFLEYPPLAIPAIALPGLAGTGESAFRLAFAGWTLLLAAAVLVLCGELAGRTGGDRRRAIFAVAAAPLLCGAMIRTHFDLAPVALLLAALLLLVRDRPRLGMAVLGAAVMTKGFPLAAAPVALAWLAGRAGRRAALEGTIALLVVAAACAGAALGMSPSGSVDAVQYQLDRPLQVESPPALLVLGLDELGLGRATPDTSHRSNGLEHPAAGALALAFQLAMLAAVALLAALAARRPDPQSLVLASLGAVAAFAVLGKVLSPQYLIWTLPLGALALAWGRLVLAGTVAAATALTLVEFPSRYFDLVDRDAFAVAVVALRDAALLAVVGLVVRVLQEPATSSWRIAVARPSSPASTSTALSHGSSSEVS